MGGITVANTGHCIIIQQPILCMHKDCAAIIKWSLVNVYIYELQETIKNGQFHSNSSNSCIVIMPWDIIANCIVQVFHFNSVFISTTMPQCSQVLQMSCTSLGTYQTVGRRSM